VVCKSATASFLPGSHYFDELALTYGKHDLNPTATNQLLNRRAKLKVAEEGFFKGAGVVLGVTPTGEELAPILRAQVGFRVPGANEWTWIREEELTTETVAPFVNGRFEIRIVGDEKFNSEGLVLRLAQLGIDFKMEGRYSDPITNEQGSVSIEHEYLIDLALMRAIAKISFNYAAYMLGAEFVRHHDFDSLRRFIRYGDKSAGNPVAAARVPMLVNDLPDHRQTRGHLSTLAWFPERGTLLGQLSPFNEITYRILFCENAATERTELSVGHLFDPFENELSRCPL
jgi:hypothetical protein